MSKSLAELIEEDRRLVVLRVLQEAADYSLNESLLRKSLEAVRLGIVGKDQMRSMLTWLADNGLVRVEKIGVGETPDLWVATVTALGAEVARGRIWPGVARPSPR